MSNSGTNILAEFAEKATYKDLPPQAIEVAKRAIMDTLGVTILGSQEPVSKIVRRLIIEEQCKEEATIIGSNLRSSILNCAFCNGISAHALDYDDVYYDLEGSTKIHPSAPIIATCLALSEKVRASGSDFIEAFVIGIEVVGAINRGLGPSHYARGWHATSTVGALGAAAAACKLMNLKTEEIQIALGIATSLASGSRQNFGTMVKPIHVGNAARNAVLSATFASDGITADKEILDKTLGFAIFSEMGDWDVKKAIDSLGDPWAVIQPGLWVKRYPSCGGTHMALDALFQILREKVLFLNDVENITVFAARPPQSLIHHRPKTGLQGKFSMEYCIACGILDGHIDIESFSDAAVLRPEIQAFLQRVQVKERKGMCRDSVTVEINCTDGSKFSRQVSHPLGSPILSMSWVDLERKYKDCTGFLLTQEGLDKSIEKIKNFESLNSVSDVIETLVPGLDCSESVVTQNKQS